ncbi:hypothetical protein LIER_05111 [Lithospermum erythrorhizon]|uniref:Reverse transcriptase domain-containing protein n=1 Tax=Lithospermum erythrorhizon TaxID=34254 RepID=A0AAV3P0J3_LITER
MDVSRRYHQIHMSLEDEEKIAFFTEYGLFCWKKMVNAIFANQIGTNMEIYVDDMLVKSKEMGNHLQNLRDIRTATDRDMKPPEIYKDVKKLTGPGTYELEEMDGKPVPRTWHASKLSKFYY